MRHRLNQLAGVIGLRIVEQRPAFALLDNAAVAQDDGVIAHHAHHVEVVTDEQESEIILTPQPVE